MKEIILGMLIVFGAAILVGGLILIIFGPGYLGYLLAAKMGWGGTVGVILFILISLWWWSRK